MDKENSNLIIIVVVFMILALCAASYMNYEKHNLNQNNIAELQNQINEIPSFPMEVIIEQSVPATKTVYVYETTKPSCEMSRPAIITGNQNVTITSSCGQNQTYIPAAQNPNVEPTYRWLYIDNTSERRLFRIVRND